MSDSIASTSRLEIRHLELGERIENEQVTQSARHLVDQAATSHRSNGTWQSPSMKRLYIGRLSSKHFAYHQPPPSKRSLIRTVPLAPPSNIPPLLDWGTGSTELEDLGLSVLEEFRSSIKPPTRGLPAAQQLLKRRRSIDERPQGLKSILSKKPRFAVPLPTPSKLPSPAVSAKVQNAALSALQSRSSTRGNGSVRLRLGLSKRTNLGSKLEPNRPLNTPYDVSVKVKLVPRNPTETGPPPFSVNESPDTSSSIDGTFALGFKVPDSALTTAKDGKLRIQLPMRAAPSGSRPFNPPRIISPKPTGKVLVPASPSPVTNKTTAALTDYSSEPESPSGCADTSMQSDGVPESSLLRNDISLTSFLPLASSVPPAGLLQANNQEAPLQGNDSANITSDILLSASLSLSLEESGQHNPPAQNDATTDLSSHLDTSYDLKSNQLMASVFYDSSQGSNASQVDQAIYSPKPFASNSAPSTTYESLPWDLSQQDDQGGTQSHEDHDLRSPVLSMVTKCIEQNPLDPSNSDIEEHSLGNIDTSSPINHHFKPGLISVSYDSSQDSPRRSPQKSASGHQYDQEPDDHSIDEDLSVLRPTWSPDTSPQSRSIHPLSGAQPSSSWGSLPGHTGMSPDDLVSASRSLSLEDFEVRRPPDHQLRNTSPGRSTTPTPLRPSPAHHSNIPIGSISGGIDDISSSRSSHISASKRSGMSKLTSYASTQGSLVGSHSPILSFTPLPKPNILDNSLESIESPDISQRIIGNSFRPNPVFKFPVPNLITEPEDDISCESQVLRPKFHSLPRGSQTTSHPVQTPEDPTPENHGARNDPRSAVPDSDRAPEHEQPAPAIVDDAKNIDNQTILQSDVPSPAPDQPSLPAPQLPPASTLANKIYKGGLHTVIPQPHFLPSLPCAPPSLSEGMLASLIPPSFQNWFDKNGKPAQDQAAVATEFLSDAWGRAAWIIPVRGRAPWDGCSAAIVSLRPIKERKKRIIVWTPASLRSFWTQMAGFRDTKRVGSLSMSFEAASGKAPELEVRKQASELKASRSFEFIKLYHDARVSLKLRTILQVLEFADEDRYGVDADVPREGELGAVTMRRLLGSSTRLALLDSTGHIVLVS